MQGLQASLEESSNPMGLTTDQAPERNLWSSLFATNTSIFKQFGDFGDFCENPRIPAYTHVSRGFLDEIVAEMVAGKVPKNADLCRKSLSYLTSLPETYSNRSRLSRPDIILVLSIRTHASLRKQKSHTSDKGDHRRWWIPYRIFAGPVLEHYT